MHIMVSTRFSISRFDTQVTKRGKCHHHSSTALKGIKYKEIPKLTKSKDPCTLSWSLNKCEILWSGIKTYPNFGNTNLSKLWDQHDEMTLVSLEHLATIFTALDLFESCNCFKILNHYFTPVAVISAAILVSDFETSGLRFNHRVF